METFESHFRSGLVRTFAELKRLQQIVNRFLVATFIMHERCLLVPIKIYPALFRDIAMGRFRLRFRIDTFIARRNSLQNLFKRCRVRNARKRDGYIFFVVIIFSRHLKYTRVLCVSRRNIELTRQSRVEQRVSETRRGSFELSVLLHCRPV